MRSSLGMHWLSFHRSKCMGSCGGLCQPHSPFSQEQRQYEHTVELEHSCLCLGHWEIRTIPLNHHFTLDHYALALLFRSAKAERTCHSSELVCWAERLFAFDYDVQHLCGLDNTVADAFSCWPLSSTNWLCSARRQLGHHTQIDHWGGLTSPGCTIGWITGPHDTTASSAIPSLAILVPQVAIVPHTLPASVEENCLVQDCQLFRTRPSPRHRTRPAEDKGTSGRSGRRGWRTERRSTRWMPLPEQPTRIKYKYNTARLLFPPGLYLFKFIYWNPKKTV